MAAPLPEMVMQALVKSSSRQYQEPDLFLLGSYVRARAGVGSEPRSPCSANHLALTLLTTGMTGIMKSWRM